MRYDSPDGAALLHQARETLLEELLPALSDEARYTALMIARAMAIAARELEGQRGNSDTPATEIMADLGADMVSELRKGRLDADPATHERLLERVRASLVVSNPKALD